MDKWKKEFREEGSVAISRRARGEIQKAFTGGEKRRKVKNSKNEPDRAGSVESLGRKYWREGEGNLKMIGRRGGNPRLEGGKENKNHRSPAQ